MKRIVFTLLVLSIASVRICHAQKEWTYVAAGFDDSYYYASHIQTEKSGYKRVWVKDLMGKSDAMVAVARWKAFLHDSDYFAFLMRQDPSARLSNDSIIYTTTVDFEMSLFEFDCGENRYRVLQCTDYYFDKHQVKRDWEGKDKWEFVVPESVGSAIAKYACASGH